VKDSCLQRKPSGQTKVAASSGITIFLLEELGDARLRCAQLKKYVDEAVKLIEKSGERDHFFEMAAHLIHGIPDTLLRMDKALTAAAMAASKMDYEDNKDDLRPEKVEELERALEEVRVRRVRYEAKQATESVMKIPEAVARLEHLAASIEATGTVNVSALSDLIVSLEGQSVKKASATTEIAGVLRNLSASLLDMSDPENRPSRIMLAATLRRVLGDTVDLKTAGFAPLKIRNREHGSGVPVDDFTAALNQAAENLYVCRGANDSAQSAVDDALTGRVARIGPLTGMPDAAIAVAEKVKRSAYELRFAMGNVANDWEHLARLMKRAVPEAERYDVKYALDTTVADDTKESRYEEGKPADPTENMDEADAKKWKSNTDEYGDKFKTASGKQAKLMGRQEKILKDYLASAGSRAAMDYDDLPSSVRDALTRVKDQETLWSDVNRWLGDNNNPHLRSASDDHLSRFEEGKPADPTENMDEDDAKEWKQNTEEYGDKFKSASFGRYANTLADQLIESRFEEGKPADPTENMDADDAKEWKQNTDEYGDKFKSAATEKDKFYRLYDQLADQHKTDDPGSSEYTRVRREWSSRADHESMSDADIKAFIVWRANAQLGDKSSPKGKIPKSAAAIKFSK